MTFRLENVSIADREVLANIITRANFDDPYGQLYETTAFLRSKTQPISRH